MKGFNVIVIGLLLVILITTTFNNNSKIVVVVGAQGNENPSYPGNLEQYNHEDIEILENLNPHLLINQYNGGVSTSNNGPNSFVFRAFITALSVCCFLLAVILMVLLRLNEEDGQLLWSSADEQKDQQQQQQLDGFIPSRAIKHATLLLLMIGMAMIMHAWTSFSSSLFYYSLVGFIVLGLFWLGRIVYRFVLFTKKQEEDTKKRLARTRRYFV